MRNAKRAAGEGNERAGGGGKREGKAGPGEKSNGPAVERFWAAGKKRKRDGVGPAEILGRKEMGRERNVLHFLLKWIQTYSIQI